MSLEPSSTSFWLLSQSPYPHSWLRVLNLAGATAGLALQGTIDCSCPNLRLQSQGQSHSHVEDLATILLLAWGCAPARVWRRWALLTFSLSIGGVIFSARILIGFTHSWRGSCVTLWYNSECIQKSISFYPAYWRGWRNSIAFHTAHNPIFENNTHSPTIPGYPYPLTVIHPAANEQHNFGVFSQTLSTNEITS